MLVERLGAIVKPLGLNIIGVARVEEVSNLYSRWYYYLLEEAIPQPYTEIIPPAEITYKVYVKVSFIIG